MTTLYRQPGDPVPYVVAGVAVTQNLLVIRDGIVGLVDLPNGTTGAVGDRVVINRKGAYFYDKAAVAFTFGQDVYYDAGNDLITNVAIGNTFVGIAIGNNGVMAGAGAGLQEQFLLAGDTAALLALGIGSAPQLIADPGNGNAIPVNVLLGNCALTSGAGAETRTIAIPTLVGQELRLSHDVDGGGNIAITVAGGIDSAGNTVITMGDAGDAAELLSMQVAGALVWRIMGNAGCALT